MVEIIDVTKKREKQQENYRDLTALAVRIFSERNIRTDGLTIHIYGEDRQKPVIDLVPQFQECVVYDKGYIERAKLLAEKAEIMTKQNVDSQLEYILKTDF